MVRPPLLAAALFVAAAQAWAGSSSSEAAQAAIPRRQTRAGTSADLGAGRESVVRRSSSEAGAFSVSTYSPKTYGASPQNWAIAQDSRGVMYFGNTDAILEYDGVSWRRILLDNMAGVRALAVDAAGTVYVGGQGVFGYLRPDARGVMQFVSLVDRLPLADRQFGDVWNVLPTPEGVYFSSDHRLFRVPAIGPVKVWLQSQNMRGVLFAAGGRVYVSSGASGLLFVDGDHLAPCPWAERFVSDRLVAAASSGGGVLLATGSHIYRMRGTSVEVYPTAADPYFADHTIYALSRLPGGDIAVGTSRGGFVLVDTQNGVSHILEKPAGLPSEFVTAIHPGLQGDVWLATDNGLAQFEPALTHFGEAQGLHGSVYAIGRLGGALYAGTTTGLYRLTASPGQDARFHALDGLKETVWVIKEHAGTSWVAAQHGLYSVSGDQLTRVLAAHLIYDVQFSPRDPNVVYTAGRDGVLVLQKAGSSWKTIAQEKGNGQDFRTVAEDDDGRLWATTRVDIWRIDFRSGQAKAERFDGSAGVPTGWKNVYRFRGHVVFATEKGLMRFSESARRFIPDDELGKQFSDGREPVSLVQEDGRGNVWITGEGYQGILRAGPSGEPQWDPMPLLASGIEELWALHLDPDGTAWASGAEGVLYRWNPRQQGDPNRDFQVLVRKVNVGNHARTLFGGSGTLASLLSLPYRENALRFEFAAPFYQDEAAVQYQMRLEGNEREWSPWTLETRKDYTNLPEHLYRFQVRARNPHGIVSPEATFSFRIFPPWYRTWWAYSLYALAIFLIARLTLRWRVRVLEAQNRKLEQTVEERTIEVRAQRDQNEALLLNILPAPVATELRDTGSVTPTAFEDVTVCFTDFVGFTLSSERLPADALVTALNEYFTAFDKIMDRYGLEKLKTIGDSYMFASGLPEPRASHAVDAVLAAFDMVKAVQDLARPEEGLNWKIRIGLYSGPVVAGVVGKRKFAFDVWGNTVNFASRMESSGAPNRVNLSATTCNRVQEFIDCQSRGHVRIKEGREVEMHFALGPKPELLAGEIVNGIPAAFRARYEAAFGRPPRAFPQFLIVSEPVLP